MKILVLGSGGREHALAWKFRQSPQVSEVFVAPGNGGVSSSSVALADHDAIIEFVRSRGIDLTFVGQEQYLVDGLVDQFQQQGLAIVGPTAAAAKLEGSKVFSKEFMSRHHIATSPYQVFCDPNEAKSYLKSRQAPYVIKADGLAAGKGVIVTSEEQVAFEAIDEMLSGKAFGDAGKQIIIEDHMSGQEVSFFALSDGKDFVLFPTCQDHKRIGMLETGKNTGGMGAYCPAPMVSDELYDYVANQVIRPTIDGMASEGTPYQGVLYVGIIMDAEGNPQVLEYNCRFGDPECQVLMLQLKTDLLELSQSVVTQRLAEQPIEFHDGASACLVLASEGYPESYEKGRLISGLEHLPDSEQSVVFHAGTSESNGVYRTHGGRVLGVTACAETLEAALQKVYQQNEKIHWEGKTFRPDIGLHGLSAIDDGRPETNVAVLVDHHDDLEVAEGLQAALQGFGVGTNIQVASGHFGGDLAKRVVALESNGIEVFVAVSRFSSQLASNLAGQTCKPVIQLPTSSEAQLASVSETPDGVPITTLPVGAVTNTAVLACQMLSLKYTDLRAKLKRHRLQQMMSYL